MDKSDELDEFDELNELAGLLMYSVGGSTFFHFQCHPANTHVQSRLKAQNRIQAFLLDASSYLYKGVCPPFGWSVGPLAL